LLNKTLSATELRQHKPANFSQSHTVHMLKGILTKYFLQRVIAPCAHGYQSNSLLKNIALTNKISYRTFST